MNLRKRNAFTLIELVAVLVIMAIIALIVTPLVMTIIKKARISADKRSIDAYGRSIELAIAGYLMDNGSFPTSIEQLTIEYSGDEVVCTTTQLNSDSSIYLAGCTVGGRNVEGYTYGSDKTPTYTAYTVGDEVTYNNVDYYVIKDSGAKESTVTLLKAEPLNVEDVNLYGGVGTENNRVNLYTTEPWRDEYRTASNHNGYGGMAYYSSSSCTFNEYSGCKNDYESSDVKYVVDAWALSNVPSGLMEAKLISHDDLVNNLGYIWGMKTPSSEGYVPSSDTPNWVYSNNYWYWTMTPSDIVDNQYEMVVFDTKFDHDGVMNDSPVVRPVIVLDKSVLSS